MQIEVFDPVLCCSSGVCGPQIDPELVRIAADLRWFEEHGGRVRRFNLGQNPAAFVQNETVRAALTHGGEAVLPLVLVNGEIAIRGRYPKREELATWVQPKQATKPMEDSPGECGCRGSC